MCYLSPHLPPLHFFFQSFKEYIKRRNKKSTQSLFILFPSPFFLSLPKCCSWWSCWPDCPPHHPQQTCSPPWPLTSTPQRTCSKIRVWGLRQGLEAKPNKHTQWDISVGEGWAEASGARQGKVCCSLAGRRGGGGRDPLLCLYWGYKMRHQRHLSFIYISS